MCAIGLAALENFTESLTKRRNVATKLKESFYDLDYINFQKGSENSTWQSLYLQVKDSENLKKITENLTNQNIEFRRDWGKPTHHYIQSDFETNLENTEILSKSCLTLPLWEEMEDEQIYRIARAVKLG
jgi:dTDP-4-amino-4,6-dideoxygalactose transaminase